MEIGIIGAGSVGLLFASYLNNSFPIRIYTRTFEQAEEINKKGILLQKELKEKRVNVTAFPISKWTGKEDLTIIAVKQYQLPSILDLLHKFDSFPQNLLFLQNGMGHLKYLESIPVPNIFVGSVEHGASKINSYTVRHNGEGSINVALFKGDSFRLKEFSEAGASVNFQINMQEDYYEMLINKLIANAVINPLTAILQVENGELISNPHYFAAVKKLFLEISYVLNLQNPIRKFRDMIRICKKTAANRSSMLKDIEAGSKTEIDAILGFLLDEAAIQKKNASNIKTYYLLIKGKEHRRRVN
ncbi:2-dehydropantoate 2-reductase [Neobacillus vireti]|uniref:2-dehydropantoate 2-reductase n=1 Tax=Neobacillus vireti TaxID=220686 RepID=UPI002FFFFE77